MSRLLQHHGKAPVFHVKGVLYKEVASSMVSGWLAGWLIGDMGDWALEWNR